MFFAAARVKIFFVTRISGNKSFVAVVVFCLFCFFCFVFCFWPYVYFTKPARIFICCPKFNLFFNFLNYSSDVTFLIALGTNFQIFEERENIVSVPRYTKHHRYRVELFLRLLGSSAKFSCLTSFCYNICRFL